MTCLSPSGGIGESNDMTSILLVVVVFFGAIDVWSPFSTRRILEANRCQPNWRQGQGNNRRLGVFGLSVLVRFKMGDRELRVLSDLDFFMHRHASNS